MPFLPNNASMSTVRRAAIICTGVSTALTLVTLLAPTPAGTASVPFHSLFVITTFLIAEYFGAALLFILGLRGFTAELKRTYTVLIVGFLLLAVGYIQLPLLTLFHWNSSSWVVYGGIGIPFLVGIGCLYAGVRGFARLFGVRMLFMSAWATLGLAVLGGIIGSFIPNASPNIPMTDITLHVSKFAQIAPALVNLATAILCYNTRKRAGSSYIPAIAWLFVYLLCGGVGSLVVAGVWFMRPGNNPLLDSGLAYIPYSISSLALIMAAVEFNAINFGRSVTVPPDEQSFFGKALDASAPQGTAADIITYLAGFVSDTAAIDPILDDMRIMTSTRDPGPFTVQEQQQLARVYLRLEKYLAETEPVRRYTREELRNMLQTRFQAVLDDNSVFEQTIRQLPVVTKPHDTVLPSDTAQPALRV